MVSQRPRRYLQNFLKLVASLWLTINPFQAMAATLVPKIIHFLRFLEPSKFGLEGPDMCCMGDQKCENRHVLSWQTSNVLS